MENRNFFKNHSDTLAIIGVNLAGLALLMSMWLSHAHRMDAVNLRMDTIYQEIKNFHGILCVIEERSK